MVKTFDTVLLKLKQW